MQKNNLPQKRAKPRSVLPCTLYVPYERPVSSQKTDKRLCTIVISALLMFALIILTVSLINAKNGGADEALPVFLSADKTPAVLPSDDRSEITVCIDPGHGFDDPGAVCTHTQKYEKELNLDIALILAERLGDMGYNIIMTRENDQPPDSLQPNENGLVLMNPDKRTDFVRKSNADLFISIHCNSLENADDVSGTKIYYYGPSDPLTLKYAKTLRDSLAAEFPERSVETIGTDLKNSYAVNRDVDIPSVLVEAGYMSTESDCGLLCDHEWRERFAVSLAQGIDEFVTNIKLKQAVVR